MPFCWLRYTASACNSFGLMFTLLSPPHLDMACCIAMYGRESFLCVFVSCSEVEDIGKKRRTCVIRRKRRLLYRWKVSCVGFLMDSCLISSPARHVQSAWTSLLPSRHISLKHGTRNIQEWGEARLSIHKLNLSKRWAKCKSGIGVRCKIKKINARHQKHTSPRLQRKGPSHLCTP